MKILLVNNFHLCKGGADTVYFNTADLLERHGHEVFFFSLSQFENVPYDLSGYFPHHRDYRMLSQTDKVKALSSFIYNREAYRKLVTMLDQIKPDVAHIHLFLGGLTTSILQALKKRKVPMVYTVHDYRLLCPAYLFLDGKNRICELCKDQFYLHCIINRCSEKSLTQSAILSMDAYFRKYVIKPLNYIDRFIFVSRFILDKHIEFISAYKPKAKALYNFIPDLKSIGTNELKGDYFLFFGRLSREKGINLLVDVVSKMSLHLKIVGTGALLDNYLNKNFRNIEFLGYKSGEELRNLVKNASFIIVPSEWYENNPLTVLEAYSFGKPVIGANIGGIPEIIEHERTGFLFEVGNKEQLRDTLLAADMMNTIQYKIMSKNAREFADIHFNPEMHYKHLISIYEEAIQ